MKVKANILENLELASIVRGSKEDFEVMFGMQEAEKVYRSEVSFYCKNFIYTQGHGIEDHALALKIFNGNEDTEYNDSELAIIRSFVSHCTPCVIDAFNSILNPES